MNTHGGKREGAGRKRSSSPLGAPTKTVRVTVDVTTDQCKSIPDLVAILDYWEELSDDSPRYYYLNKMLEEIRLLGY